MEVLIWCIDPYPQIGADQSYASLGPHWTAVASLFHGQSRSGERGVRLIQRAFFIYAWMADSVAFSELESLQSSNIFITFVVGCSLSHFYHQATLYGDCSV
jgi:hypothetical protein